MPLLSQNVKELEQADENLTEELDRLKQDVEDFKTTLREEMEDNTKSLQMMALSEEPKSVTSGGSTEKKTTAKDRQ